MRWYLAFFLLIPLLARADAIDNFTLAGGGWGVPIQGDFTWQMPSDLGVITPYSILPWDPDVYYDLGTVSISYLGGTVLYDLTMNATVDSAWMQYQGGQPNVPLPNPGVCSDQFSWGECLGAIYYATGFSWDGPVPYSIGPTGDFTWNVGTYGYLTISDPPSPQWPVSTPEPATVVFEIFGMAMIGLLVIFGWTKKEKSEKTKIASSITVTGIVRR